MADEAKDLLVRTPGLEDLDAAKLQALLEDLRGVGREGTGDAAADIGPVGAGRGKSEELSIDAGMYSTMLLRCWPQIDA